MAEYQITYWRDFPSMVVARSGDETVKVSLASRFQEAIDEAAMRLDAADADAYLDGWNLHCSFNALSFTCILSQQRH